MKETTPEDRAAIIREVTEAFHGAGQEWARHWVSIEDEGILHGADVRLCHQEDGTTIVELDGAEMLRLRFTVSVEVVEMHNAVNKPTGPVLQKTWATVPSMWFVQTPKGDWIETGRTNLAEGDKQMVALRIGDSYKAFPRDPAATVSARRGTLAPRDRDSALEALGGLGATIQDDAPPWEE
jgi:hypothetical protein